MKEIKDLKEFCRYVLSCTRSGYKFIKINEIPKKKADNPMKLEKILKKVSDNYNSDKNKDWRYRNKRAGNANYISFYYLNKIYIFRTSGKILEHQENGFKEFGNKIKFSLSEYLELILFKDERDKFTFRLSKTTLKAKKERLKIAILNKNGRNFHYEINILGGLPTYRGLQLQKISIKKYINKLQKRRKFKYSLPKYL